MIEGLRASQNLVLTALIISTGVKIIYLDEKEEEHGRFVSATAKFVSSIALQVFSLHALTVYAPKIVPSISKLGSPSITMSLAGYSFTKILSSNPTRTFSSDEIESKVWENKLAFVGVVALFVLKSVTDKVNYVDLLSGSLFGVLVGLTDLHLSGRIINHSVDNTDSDEENFSTYDNDQRILFDDTDYDSDPE